MISAKAGHSLDRAVIGVYRFFSRGAEVSPNVCTIIGLCFGVFAAALIAAGHQVPAGLVLICSGFFDLLDGALARARGTVSRLGGFLDSVLDRYTDLLVMLAIIFRYAANGETLMVLATGFGSVGVALIPYARAKAESLGIACNAGLLERGERMAILLAGLLFGLLAYAVVLLAVLTHVTVIQRILHVKKAIEKTETQETRL